MAKPRYVYFMKPVGMEGPVKIGCSDCPEHRLFTLAAWSPFPLEMLAKAPGGFAEEQRIHSCFAHDHIHREWFRVSKTLTDLIASVCKTGTLDAHLMLNPTGSVRNRGPRTLPEYLSGIRSYSARIRWAEIRLRREDENGRWHAPADVCKIMSRWNYTVVQGQRVEGKRPSPEEFARLDEYLAAPGDHADHPWWVKSAADPAPSRQEADAR